jgi:hypothetical protein
MAAGIEGAETASYTIEREACSMLRRELFAIGVPWRFAAPGAKDGA